MEKIFLIYPLEDLLSSRADTPTQPLLIIKAFTKTGAQAALYLAIKEGELDAEINIEDCFFLDITEIKQIKAQETNEHHLHQVPNWG